jgi:hypothetical protein
MVGHIFIEKKTNVCLDVEVHISNEMQGSTAQHTVTTTAVTATGKSRKPEQTGTDAAGQS